MDTNYEERSVWVQLVSLVVVLGGYFVVAGLMMARGEAALSAYLPLFIAVVVLLVIVLALGHVLALLFGMPEKHDERDRQINWRADSYAQHALAGGVLVAIGGMVLGVESVWVAHFLLFTLLVHELLKLALQLVFYRRGV